MFVLRFAEGGDPKVVEEIESIMKGIEECTDQLEIHYDAWLASHDQPSLRLRQRLGQRLIVKFRCFNLISALRL